MKILIVMDEGIGNMINLTPAIRGIKNIMPESQITVFGKKPAIELISGHELIYEAIDTPESDSSYDIGILAIFYSGYAARFADIIKNQCKALYYIKANKHIPEYLSFMKAAEFFGYKGGLPVPFWMWEFSDYAGNADQKQIGLCNTSQAGWDMKRWDKYPELAWALHDSGYQVVLIGGKYEADVFKASLYPESVVNCLGKYSMQKTVDLLSLMDIVVGNDCGIARVAAAMNKPTIFLFGSSNIPKNAPLGDNVSIIDKRLPCAPCIYTDRIGKCEKYRCMEAISVADIVAEVRSRQNGKDSQSKDKEVQR